MAGVDLPWAGPQTVALLSEFSRSDLMLAAVAVAVSNVPGGSVIEVRRATATVFLHVLDADRPEQLEAARHQVW
ncbi:hypothetical protein DDE05_23550, partial [Streptomyces cavourensis]